MRKYVEAEADAQDESSAQLSPRRDARYGGPLPKYELPQSGLAADDVYQLIRGELELDGSARLNLATFVTTWMEPQAEKLMDECFAKNMIDKDEYPQTAEVESRCVNIIARLFNAPSTSVGASTVGSSEAVMLAGMALKWRWRQRREQAGKPADRPNLVMGSNVQVVWEKFCRYWEVEPRYLPMEPGRYVIQPEQVSDACDENTIGVVAILGTTYTGEYEPVADVHAALDALDRDRRLDIPMHIDAASGGFVAPFTRPELEWDFRLPRVKSINVSGHKYGLVYPGIGWAIWRAHEDLPEELVFRVDYLGGDMPTFTLNFSRGGNQIVGQYYNFLRLGFEGYQRIMSGLHDIATWLSASIEGLGPFTLFSRGDDIPVFAFGLADSSRFSVYDVSDRLRRHGWQVPAYAMPEGAEQEHALRIVVRDGFSFDMGRALIDDLKEVLEDLERNPPAAPRVGRRAFAH